MRGQGQFEPCACKRRSLGRPRLTRLTNNKHLLSRSRLQAAAKRGPDALANDRVQPRLGRRRRVQAVWDGAFPASTVAPSYRRIGRNRTRAARKRLLRWKYSKQLKDTNVRNDPSLPADGQWCMARVGTRQCSDPLTNKKTSEKQGFLACNAAQIAQF